MTLLKKSVIVCFLIIGILIFSIKLFVDYNNLHHSLTRNLTIIEEITRTEYGIYRLLAGTEKDIDASKNVLKNILEVMAQVEADELTKEEYEKLIEVRLAFLRLGRILEGTKGKDIEAPILRQIDNELLKVEASSKDLIRYLKKRIEREMALRAKAQAFTFGVSGIGVIFIFIGFYHYFLRPIFNLNSQIQAVRDKRAENIEIYEGRDEIGRFSEFLHEALNDLNKGNDSLSRQLEMQSAMSMILRAAQNAAEIDSFLQKVLDITLSLRMLTIKDRGGISLIDETDPERLILKAERNYLESQKNACSTLLLGRCICGKAAKEGKIIYKRCIDEDHETMYEGISPHGHYCVPIKHDDRVLGIINLYLDINYIPNDMDMEFLENISIIIADTLEMKKLAEREHLITRAIEESGEGIVITDRYGDIEYANPAHEAITGYSEDEIIGNNFITDMKCWGVGEDTINDLVDGNAWAGKLKNKRKNGRDFYEHLSITPVRNEINEIMKYVSIVRDITRESSLEEQLRQAQKMEIIGRFAGGIAHDFNNILTTIKGYGRLLMEDMKDEDPMRDFVKEIILSADRAAGLTKSILAFSRKQPITPMPVNLNEVIRRVEKLIIKLIGENIELRITLAQGDIIIMADTGQIEQVLMNLATNAKDAMPDRGVLSIKTSVVNIDEAYAKSHIFLRPGPHALLSVSDTGVGMNEETRERIFEPFFTTKGIGKGTGLGLSIVYGIIKQHEGTINVYSEHGKGSIFKIYIPLLKTEAKMREPAEEVIAGGGTETVLLAEDDDPVRRLIKEVIEKHGYKVLEAVDGNDAVRVFSENRDDIQMLLFDIAMPKKNGVEAYEEILNINPGIKTIFMSGYTEDMIYRKGILEKGLTFISKPVSPDDILTKMREVLDK